jgi:type IV pilus assembly protein PilM
MAKALNQVTGIDLGNFAIKCVQLQRKGDNRFIVTHYSDHPLGRPLDSPEAIAAEIKAALKEMGGSARHTVVAVSSSEALIRLIDQPETPTELLRDALRLNGMALLNQDCRDWVLDCDPVTVTGEDLGPGRRRYLVGGLPRATVVQLEKALSSVGAPVSALQLSSVCLLNAFEFTHREVYSTQGFLLVDIGFLHSTMVLGARRELVFVRHVDVGGHTILESLCALSGESRESVLIALDQEDEVMVENARVAMINLIREISSSIGFFEGRREESIRKIHVSGGIAKAPPMLRVLTHELSVPCEAWNPFDHCEISLPSKQRERFPSDMFDLHVACGAAAELLIP